MATHQGSEGHVEIGANTVAELTAWRLEHSVNTIDDTAMADTAKTHLVGQQSWSGTLTCHWDETDTTGQGALTIGASITLNLYPEGDGTGDTYFTGTATITRILRETAIESVISAEFEFTGNGVLTTSTA
jgi:hypothetical protein